MLDPESGMRTRPKRRRGSERMTLRQLRQSAAAPFEVQAEDADTEAEDSAHDFIPEAMGAGARAWLCHRLHGSRGVKSTILKRRSCSRPLSVWRLHVGDGIPDASSGKAPAYDAAQSVAYTATRFPATYAVLQKACRADAVLRHESCHVLHVSCMHSPALPPSMLMSSTMQVMEELRLRRPGFQPTRMLDFGAGPGTAIWAATQVQTAVVQCQTCATLPSRGSRLLQSHAASDPQQPYHRLDAALHHSRCGAGRPCRRCMLWRRRRPCWRWATVAKRP